MLTIAAGLRLNFSVVLVSLPSFEYRLKLDTYLNNLRVLLPRQGSLPHE
jgi:hypothetical protein